MRKATVTLATILMLSALVPSARAITQPASVTGVMYTVIAERQTSLTWIGTPTADSYRIYVNGALARTTTDPSTRIDMTLGRLLGPADTVEVQSVAADGTNSSKVRAEYWDYTWVPVPTYTLTFDSSSSVLTSKSRATLRAFAAYVADHGFAEIRLIGRSSGTPGSVAAYAMGKARAEHARTYLVSLSDASTLVSSWGASWPMADLGTLAGQALNRRVDLQVR